MERTNKNPIWYASTEEMNKPLSELMEDLRKEVARVRGKLFDIKSLHGWHDRIEDLEGGLTCCIVAMGSVQKEFKDHEAKAAKPKA